MHAGLIAPKEALAYERVLARFPLLLPEYYAGLIDRNDPLCPIRRQCLPDFSELELAEGFVNDPLEDLRHQPAPRITHRYAGRVLLHLTPNCSMNCRYCFRKNLLNEDRAEFFEGEVAQAVSYIADTPEVEEVIFSGGDPFLANEKTLTQVLERLRALPHVKRVRFHSRVPVTLPMRVDRTFAELLAAHGKPSVVVCHFNHPRELTLEAKRSVWLLREAGHTVLNQSVLLRGVNDASAVLCELSEGLFESGVLPYYLHHPDRAQGTKHYDLPRARGIEIHTQMRLKLPGYLVPRYVVDDPTCGYKQDITS